jgi:hypothetical protein
VIEINASVPVDLQIEIGRVIGQGGCPSLMRSSGGSALLRALNTHCAPERGAGKIARAGVG